MGGRVIMLNTNNNREGKFKGNNCQEMKKTERLRDWVCEGSKLWGFESVDLKQTDWRYFSSKDGCIQNWCVSVCVCVCVCVCVLVAQSCPTLCDLMDYSPTGFSIHGILQAKILRWEVIPFSRGSSRLRDRIQISCNPGGLFNHLSHQGSPIQDQQRIANQSLPVLSSQRKKTSIKGRGKLAGQWPTQRLRPFTGRVHRAFLLGSAMVTGCVVSIY